MATSMVGKYCRDAVIEQWCPDLVTGNRLASYCLTEPGAGFDAAALRTTAVRDGDDYLVSGSEVYLRRRRPPDVLVVRAHRRTRSQGISALLIPADAEVYPTARKRTRWLECPADPDDQLDNAGAGGQPAG